MAQTSKGLIYGLLKGQKFAWQMAGLVLQQQNLNIGKSSEASNTTPQKSPYRRLLKKSNIYHQTALKRKAAAAAVIVVDKASASAQQQTAAAAASSSEGEDDLEIEGGDEEDAYRARKRANHGSPKWASQHILNNATVKRDTKKHTFIAPAANIASVKPTTTTFGEWQRHHKKKFPTFTFYLDGVDGTQKKRLTIDIARLKGSVEPFFSKRVTHIITTRPIPGNNTTHSRKNSTDENSRMTLQEMAIKAPYGSSKLKLPQNDADGYRQDVLVKAKEFDLHIWSLNKAISILDALLRRDEVGVADTKGVTAAAVQQPHGDNLAKALREERVYGTKERDVNAKQEQFVPFRGAFVLARDLNNVYQPIISREFKRVDEARNGEWPQFRATSNGRCPFVVDPYVTRQQTATAKVANKENTAPAPRRGEVTLEQAVENKSATATFRPPPVPAILQKSAAANRPAYRPPPDVDASGVFNSSNLNSVLRTQTSMTTSNAARVEPYAQPSKEVRDLTRKVLKAGFTPANTDTVQPPPPPQPSKLGVKPKNTSKVDPKSTSNTNPTGDGKCGFCENCRQKFDHYNLVRGPLLSLILISSMPKANYIENTPFETLTLLSSTN